MDPFIGEIRLFGFNFAPRGWACCNGQLLSISNYTALFALLGTNYGGNGQTTFALPTFTAGIVPIGFGTRNGGPTYELGERDGADAVTLAIAELPAHTHQLQGGIQSSPPNPRQITNVPTAQALFGPSSPGQIYAPNATVPAVAFSPQAISVIGGSQPHENRQPYLELNYCIAREGIFPTRN